MPRSSVWVAGGLVLAGLIGAGVWTLLPGPAQMPESASPPGQARTVEVVEDTVAMARDDGEVPAEAVEHWQQLTPAERADVRARYAALSNLSEEERTHLAHTAARFDALPAAEQQRLTATFEAQDRLVRRGWRLGIELGADYPRLHPLLAFVPEAQHAVLIHALRAMSVQERASLALLVQRTPPHERDALRDTLLKTPQALRAQWLASRLQE